MNSDNAMYLIEAPPKPVGEKRVAFYPLEWPAFKQIQQLLSGLTRARFSYEQRHVGNHRPLKVTNALLD